jgi:hypothetical protein
MARVCWKDRVAPFGAARFVFRASKQESVFVYLTVYLKAFFAPRSDRTKTRVRGVCAHVERRLAFPTRYKHLHSPRPAHRACGPAPLARGLLGPSHRRGRWADVLHHRPSRSVPGGGHVCRPYPARRQACRSSGAGANQVRNCHQSQDAKALGLTVPPGLLVAADEVIE